MRLRIISDGTTVGTRVVNKDTGESLENVEYVEWKVDAYDGLTTGVLILKQVDLEVEDTFREKN